MVGKPGDPMSMEDLATLMSRLGDFPSAKIKLDDFFTEWISLESTKRMITEILEDNNNRSALGPDSLSNGSNREDRIIVSATMTQPPPRSPTKASPKKRSQEEMNTVPSSSGVGGEYSGVNHVAEKMNLKLDIANSVSSSRSILSTSTDTSTSVVGAMDDYNSRRHRANVDSIPIFYTPSDDKSRRHGLKSIDVENDVDSLAKRLTEIETFFKPYPQGIPIEKFVHVTKRLCGIPSFFNLPLCKRINTLFGDEGPNVHLKSTGNKTNRGAAVGSGTKIKLKAFIQFWKAEMEPYDKAERFFRLVKQIDNPCICKDDFIPYIQELLHFHPGLDFLQQHEEFQRKYALTVITRIFYKANRSRTGRITLKELRYSNVMTEFMHVDEETDINKVTEYFSYEHFYVLYCRFFELDVDKDSKLMPEDLMKYNEHALSEGIIDRIFQLGTRAFSDGLEGGFLKPNTNTNSTTNTTTGTGAFNQLSSEASNVPGMTYSDFIYFMLSEEDKTNECALRYWFACCDLDSNKIISIDEMRYFYKIQLTRLTNLGQESVSFQDVLCQMLDMLSPDDPLNLTIKDFLKPNKIQLSGRDPFQEKQKREDSFNTDWDRFAFTEYHRLAAEEEGYDNTEDNGITMDIDENVMMHDTSTHTYMHTSFDDDSDNYHSSNATTNHAQSGTKAGNYDWYLDDDDEKQTDYKKTGANKTANSNKNKK